MTTNNSKLYILTNSTSLGIYVDLYKGHTLVRSKAFISIQDAIAYRDAIKELLDI